MKRLTLLSFLGLLFVMIIVASNHSPNQSADNLKSRLNAQSSQTGCCNSETDLAISDYKKPCCK